MSNLNPLTPCRRGAFWVENVPGGLRIEYELDLLDLLLWTSAVAAFLCTFGSIELVHANAMPLEWDERGADTHSLTEPLSLEFRSGWVL